MANIAAIFRLGVPPFAKPPCGDKGGQGGFLHTLVSQPPSNPPQPPFIKGGSFAGAQP
jgi:hypothetical protein